jgi:hypothetical protein
MHQGNAHPLDRCQQWWCVASTFLTFSSSFKANTNWELANSFGAALRLMLVDMLLGPLTDEHKSCSVWLLEGLYWPKGACSMEDMEAEALGSLLLVTAVAKQTHTTHSQNNRANNNIQTSLKLAFIKFHCGTMARVLILYTLARAGESVARIMEVRTQADCPERSLRKGIFRLVLNEQQVQSAPVGVLVSPMLRHLRRFCDLPATAVGNR